MISCTAKQHDHLSSEKKSELDNYLQEAMKVHEIPGLALAIVKDNEVIYHTHLGNASIEESVPVEERTVFRVFSATKLITATGVFQLIENGKVSLEDSLSEYFDNLPNAWGRVRIKNLLTHSSGLPDLRYPASLSDKEVMEKLVKEKMDFETGSQFRYNQTNYWLLARIIEKVTGVSFDEYILKNQFEESEDGVLFSSNSKKEVQNRATRYYYDQQRGSFRKDTINGGSRAHSGNGLNISLNEFIGWNKRLNTNELLAEETKTQMWTPFQFENGKDKFLHGWGIYDVANKTSYGFTGGNLAGFRKFVNNDLTVIFLSNGYVHPGYDIVINDVSKIVLENIGNSRPMLEQDVMKLMLDKEYQAAKTTFIKLKEKDPNHGFDNLKWNINSLGNSFFRKNEIFKALPIYKLNVESNPDWWVAHAGYAEGLEEAKDFENALSHYEKAIQLNVNNDYGYNDQMKEKVKELKKPL